MWERPENLVGRADVDKMVASPPDAPNATQASTTNTNNSTGVTKRAGTSNDSSDEDHPSPSKKIKKEEQPVKGKILALCAFGESESCYEAYHLMWNR